MREKLLQIRLVELSVHSQLLLCQLIGVEVGGWALVRASWKAVRYDGLTGINGMCHCHNSMSQNTCTQKIQSCTQECYLGLLEALLLSFKFSHSQPGGDIRFLVCVEISL